MAVKTGRCVRIVLGFFLNTAIDQQVEKHLLSKGQLESVRSQWAAKYEKAGLKLPSYGAMAYDSANPRHLGLGLLGISGTDGGYMLCIANVEAISGSGS